jgi:hypothetical protein
VSLSFPQSGQRRTFDVACDRAREASLGSIRDGRAARLCSSFSSLCRGCPIYRWCFSFREEGWFAPAAGLQAAALDLEHGEGDQLRRLLSKLERFFFGDFPVKKRSMKGPSIAGCSIVLIVAMKPKATKSGKIHEDQLRELKGCFFHTPHGSGFGGKVNWAGL